MRKWIFLIVCAVFALPVIAFSITLGVLNDSNPFLSSVFEPIVIAGGCALLISALVMLFVTGYERRKIITNIQSSFIVKDYQTAYDYLVNKGNRYWSLNNELTGKLALLITCLLLRKVDMAEEVLNKTKWFNQKNTVLIYRYAFLLNKQKVDEAKLLLPKFITFTFEPLLSDRIVATEMMRAVETGFVEQSVYDSIQFPLFKEVFDFYGKREEKPVDDVNSTDRPFSSAVELE